MKKYILGGLCALTFIATAAANLAIQDLNARPKDHPVREVSVEPVPVVCTAADSKELKATSLEVVSMKGCGPCARLKPILKDLILDGYDIYIIDIEKDTRGTTAAPSLYFLDCDGEVLVKLTGFRTAEQIKKYLAKCP